MSTKVYKGKMVSSLALIDDNLAHVDIESLFSVDNEATTETVLAFSLDEFDYELDYSSSSESDEIDHFPYKIQTFEFSNIFLAQPLAKVQILLGVSDPYQSSLSLILVQQPLS